MKKLYYVYAYLRQDRYSPYYIGKGQNKRAFAKHTFTETPTEDRIVFIKENLTEEDALALEAVLIKFWGCKWDGGVLENKRTRGGKSYITEETKRKISAAGKGKRLGNNNAKSRPVTYMGVSYPSVVAAARAHNCQTRTIRRHLENGGEPKERNYNRKPVTFRGVTYPSRTAAAKANNICRKTLDWHLTNK